MEKTIRSYVLRPPEQRLEAIKNQIKRLEAATVVRQQKIEKLKAKVQQLTARLAKPVTLMP